MKIDEKEIKSWIVQDITRVFMSYIEKSIQTYVDMWLLGHEPSQQYVAALKDVLDSVKSGAFAQKEEEEEEDESIGV